MSKDGTLYDQRREKQKQSEDREMYDDGRESFLISRGHDGCRIERQRKAACTKQKDT